MVLRADKAIKDSTEITDIIKKCQVCRLAFSQNDKPYIVPVSFGYDGRFLYFHSARAGKKVDMLSVNKNVCFEFESEVAVIPDETAPCNWSFSFQSVIGFGQVEEFSTIEDKTVGLKHIMSQYSNKNWNFENIPVNGLRVFKIIIDSMTGKQSPPPADKVKSIDEP